MSGDKFKVTVPANGPMKFFRLHKGVGQATSPTLQILASPAGAAVNMPTNLTLGVVVSGSGSYSYQWKLNGTVLRGATNSTLSVTVTNLTNLGGYNVDTFTPILNPPQACILGIQLFDSLVAPSRIPVWLHSSRPITRH